MVCEIEFSRENYRKVVKTAANVLVQNPTTTPFLYIQTRALLQCKRYNEAIKISRSVVFQGQASHEVWVLLAKAYFYIKDYKTLFVLINTALNLIEEPPEYLNPVSRQMGRL
jgi:predicted Zn-dependent protease